MSKEEDEFSFNESNAKKVTEIIERYPKCNKKSAVMPLLHIAQKQNNGWLSKSAIKHVASILEMHYNKVYELVSFYSMYNDKEVGRHHIKICSTMPCWLNGSANIVTACEKKLNIKAGQTTKDKMFTITKTQCLGACIDAPLISINDNYIEKVSPEKITLLVDNIYYKNSSTQKIEKDEK
ncbi:NADH-quinone oxidoreductase subunit E [Candidatus Xenohaliotis californiensis]|uniref:NADH-quinone oxidoreductase subunit E n=1 Tax=Candidatus Xenohaliotis californiensis TaxID=84677 RepID=A0ABP0EUC6_9RICK|nr:NADH-quinone oxidoreductase subunit E [Candidatus Xenohaliotis californiensis]